MKMHKVRLNIVATLDYSTITNTLTIKIVYCEKKHSIPPNQKAT